jgi:DNA-binding beta-propeller fold protein YncE
LIDLLAGDPSVPVESFNLHLDAAVGATSGTALPIAGTTASGSIASLPPEVVAITDVAAFGSSDPFGLAYVPGLDTLFMADPQGLSHVNNLFALNLDGTQQPNGVSSLGFGLQPAYLAFGYKPAGLAFDPSSGRLYIADDDQLKIEWVDPANPTKELSEFSAQALGSTDTEDVAVNPNNGHVFIVNGGDFGAPKIIETDATGSQIFSTIDLKTAVQGQPIGSPEGVAYDAARDVFFVAGNNYDIKVVDRSGSVLDDITLLSNYRNPTGNIGVEIQGLTLAPSSDPNDDPAKLNLYVADAGLLNGPNDGRLIEIDLHSGLLFA